MDEYANPLALSLERILDEIYPEVASKAELASYPTSTVRLRISPHVNVVFVLELGFADGSRQRHPVTTILLSEWGVAEGEMVGIVSSRGSVIDVNQWEQVNPTDRVYRYPRRDRDWTPCLLRPEEFSALSLCGEPVMAIPDPDTCYVAGFNDRDGERAIRREVSDISGESLTPHLLVCRDGQWMEMS